MDNGSATIFVADDNTILLQGLERALSSQGYAVQTAGNGAALIEMLEEAPTSPDLLLLDVMMPELTGFEVLQKVHGDPRWMDVPVMLITAVNDEMLPVSALQGGAVDFLTKPFRLGELLARIEAHIQRFRELRKARAESHAHQHTLDIIRDLNRTVTANEMFQLVTRRAADIWGVSRCSVIVDDGEGMARVVASSESDSAVGLQFRLHQYPEITAALSSGEPLLVENVFTSPLFRDMRREWKEQGTSAPLRSVVVVPLCLTPDTQAALILRSTEGEPVLGEEAVAVTTQIVEGMIQSLGRAHIFESLIEQRRQLDALAHIDELTGCATRRSLMRRLNEEFFLARRHESPLSLVILDLDGFKAVNDIHGHLAGDAVLRALGEWLQGHGGLRANDCAGRYGGDEFIVLLPHTDREGAIAFAERARSHLASLPFVHKGQSIRVTLSAGVATWKTFDTVELNKPDDLIARADAALYAAKSSGRNSVHTEINPPVVAAAQQQAL